MEPFGGTDDFDISATHVVYTTKDPLLLEPFHTKQNVCSRAIISKNLFDTLQIYIVDIQGKEKPKELTSKKNAATHNPVFNTSGTKVAWLELNKDGSEADRCAQFLSASDPR